MSCVTYTTHIHPHNILHIHPHYTHIHPHNTHTPTHLVPTWTVGPLLNTGLLDVLAANHLNDRVDPTAHQLSALEYVNTHLKVHDLVGKLVPLASLASLRLLGGSVGKRWQGSTIMIHTWYKCNRGKLQNKLLLWIIEAKRMISPLLLLAQKKRPYIYFSSRYN